VALDLSGHGPVLGSGQYSRGVNEIASAPWAEPSATSLAGKELGGRAAETASAPWADPPELVAVLASLREAQERIDRATKQLELAAELEARLRALLEGRSGQELPLLGSPERQAAELEATGILLKAELRAAKILNYSRSRGDSDSYRRAAIDLDAARALEGQLGQLADIEATLAAIGRQLARREIAGEPGPSRIALDSGPAQRRVRPVGQSVPVPFFRRPRRDDPA